MGEVAASTNGNQTLRVTSICCGSSHTLALLSKSLTLLGEPDRASCSISQTSPMLIACVWFLCVSISVSSRQVQCHSSLEHRMSQAGCFISILLVQAMELCYHGVEARMVS